MLNGVTYTEAEIQSTAMHLIELLRRQYLGNSPKTRSQLTILQKPMSMATLT